MKTERISLLGSLVILALGVGFAAYHYKGHIKPVVAGPAIPTPEAQFTAALDTFVKNLAAKSHDYKNSRKVVTDLVRPQNLGNPEDIRENEKLMETLIPTLDQKMDATMAVFVAADERINRMVKNVTAPRKKTMLEAWKKLKDEQSESYIDFFKAEQDSLKATRDLMKFYVSLGADVGFDDVTGKMAFKNPADAAKEQALRHAAGQTG